jgi:hypothetical protein
MTEPTQSPRHSSSLFNTTSDRLPDTLPVRLLRLWIPLALCIIGTILLLADEAGEGRDAEAVEVVGAGSSTWLINFLWRLGVSGDDERDLEAKDRDYLAEHGHWPDEQNPPPQA